MTLDQFMRLRQIAQALVGKVGVKSLIPGPVCQALARRVIAPRTHAISAASYDQPDG
jgi:hypothetical protein